MYKRKRFWLMGIGVLIILVLLGFWQKKERPENDGVITIGFCIDNLVIERWQRDQEIFRSEAKASGVEVIVYNAFESNETQNEQIRLLIEQKVDVMVIIPYDKDGVAEAVADAQKAGIKVIAYDRLINNAQVDAYISFDNVKVGRLQAQSVIAAVPKGNVAIIAGSPEDNNAFMFYEGYMAELSSMIRSGRYTIIHESWANHWREEVAFDAIGTLLEAGTVIDAVIAANDRLAEAVIQQLAQAGLAGTVFVSGHDADISACQRIVEGTQGSTVYKPIRQLAEAAVALAINLANDEPFDYNTTINNGYMEVPYIQLDVFLVTPETMDETVIADGFHLYESVYRD